MLLQNKIAVVYGAGGAVGAVGVKGLRPARGDRSSGRP